MKLKKLVRNYFIGGTVFNTIIRIRSIYNPIVRNHLFHLSKLANFYSHFFRKGDLVFDVGANTGQKTEHFLQLGASVLAIEPNPDCVAKIRQKFIGCKRLSIQEVAVGNEVGYTNMNICLQNSDFFWEDPSVFSTLLQKENITKRFNNERSVWLQRKVAVTTLDVLISKYGCPKYCKIDVEGFEPQVLEGLNSTIQSISIEYMFENHSSLVRCIQRLKELGAYQYRFVSGNSFEFSTADWMNEKELLNHLSELSLKNSALWGDVYAKILC